MKIINVKKIPIKIIGKIGLLFIAILLLSFLLMNGCKVHTSHLGIMEMKEFMPVVTRIADVQIIK
jgi:hypothetical protein